MNLPLFSRDADAARSANAKAARARCWLSVLLLIGLAGCASRAPEPTLYLLRSDPPPGVSLPADAWARIPASSWQLVLPVRVPESLDRSALLLPQGTNGLQPSNNQRWVERLSSSVPRVLAQDLNALRGQGSVWTAPVPDKLLLKGQLHVAVLAVEVAPSAAAVTLKARWSTAPHDASQAPRAHLTTITVPSQGSETDGLVAAHRLALWPLAQAMAGTLE